MITASRDHRPTIKRHATVSHGERIQTWPKSKGASPEDGAFYNATIVRLQLDGEYLVQWEIPRDLRAG
jgi:hypothetical protein